MFAKRKFQLFFQRQQKIPLNSKKNYNFKNYKIFFGLLYNFLFEICFKVGNFLLNVFLILQKKIRSDFKLTKQIYKLRKNKFNSISWKEVFSVFLLWSFILFVFVFGARALTYAFFVKNKTINLGLSGLEKLNTAKSDLLNADFETAENKFFLAQAFFEDGLKQISLLEKDFFKLTNLFPEKNRAESLLNASAEISRAGQLLAEAMGKLHSLKISVNGIEQDNNFLTNFQTVETNFATASNLLANAQKKLITIPELSKKTELLNKLKQGVLAVKLSSQTFSAFKKILFGKNTVLLLFQNNNELRTTGGFLGSYGLLKVENGKLQKIQISSIYDLDGQLKENILPPTPLLNVNSNWYMRDSNWFADFPTSAKKILQFYEKEGGETPKLTIALTPNVIVDLLKITGPISLPRYNIELNSENFIETTQVYTSVVDKNEPLNQPKAMLADFFVIFLQKLTEKNSNNFSNILFSIYNSAKQKDLQFYASDIELNSYFENLNFTGKIFPTDRDYLSINNANLGGTKTDLDINQNVSLKTEIQESGKILNTLTITKKNPLPNLTSAENLSFIRVYVPLGSKLLEATGFNAVKTEKPEDKNYKTDPDVYFWEKNIVRELLGETIIGHESGKTFFGNWLKLLPGETKTVTLTYELPFKLKDIDRYSLLLQNQAGAKPINFSWDFSFNGFQTKWQNFSPEDLKTNSVKESLVLNKDYLLGLLLVKN